MRINIDKDVKIPKQYSKVWMTRHQILAWFWISGYLGVDMIDNKGRQKDAIGTIKIYE